MLVSIGPSALSVSLVFFLSAEGAFNTSLGWKPKEQGRKICPGLKARTIDGDMIRREYQNCTPGKRLQKPVRVQSHGEQKELFVKQTRREMMQSAFAAGAFSLAGTRASGAGVAGAMTPLD